ncbi:leucine-rich repeat domain-containing protein [Treponema sp. OMZ 840]|uniref:leucine-rich repeat protein n=1 Tax=Treponema sp. OMZ 840 TaxID=244313 RepID=UPI003D938892
MKHTKNRIFTNRAAVFTLAASLVIMGLFTACPNAAGGGNTGGGSSGGGSGPAYVKVAYAELDTYLANTALSTKVNYIEVTGTIPADNFRGSGGSPSALGQKIKAHPAKKVALKLPGEVADLDNMKFCFYGCTNLVSLAGIPASVKDMTDCFNGCISLTQAPDIPSSVIGMKNCFRACTSLTQNPVIPTSVITMESCFRDCTSLTQAPGILASVTDMSFCFSGCTSLTQVPDIPESVTDMRYCFSGCSALKGVKLLCNYEDTWNEFEKVFEGCTALETGGIQIPGAYFGNYADAAALNAMAVPGNTYEERKAKFAVIGGEAPKYKVTLEPASDGTVTVNPALPSDGMVAENTEITFTASPHAGYKLQKWELNGQAVNGAAPTYKLKVTQNASVKAFFVPRPNTVYLAGTIGTIGNEKPHYWKDGTKHELPMDSEMTSGLARSLTLKGGKAYSAGEQQRSGQPRARVWEGNTLYWSQDAGTVAQAILSEGASLYIAGRLEKDGAREASVADITDKNAVRIAHLRTSTGTEEGSEAYALCSSPSALYAVGKINNSNSSQKKGALWTINKALNEASRTETVLATGSYVWPKAVCFLDGAVYAAGRNAAQKAAVWKVTGTGSSADVTPTELGIYGSEANAACTKDGRVFIGGRNSGNPCVWKGKDSSFTAIKLSTEAGTVNALYAFGTDIYAAGYILESGVKKAAYWKFTSAISSAADADITVLTAADSEALGIVVTME